jgi:hypothetical protein
MKNNYRREAESITLEMENLGCKQEVRSWEDPNGELAWEVIIELERTILWEHDWFGHLYIRTIEHDENRFAVSFEYGADSTFGNHQDIVRGFFEDECWRNYWRDVSQSQVIVEVWELKKLYEEMIQYYHQNKERIRFIEGDVLQLVKEG